MGEKLKQESKKKNEKIMDGEFTVFRISSGSNVVKTSDAIVKSIQEGLQIELQGVGAGAVNQAVKAIAAATGKLAANAVSIVTTIGFRNIEIPNIGERTMMVFKLLETG